MGPLRGIKIVEIVGIGPAPHCCMILSDMGAEIIRIDRPSGNKVGGTDEAAILNRGRKSIALDLKTPEGVNTARRLIRQADGLVEGFRPGVMERIGLGPEVCLEDNKKLVYLNKNFNKNVMKFYIKIILLLLSSNVYADWVSISKTSNKEFLIEKESHERVDSSTIRSWV